MLTTVIRSFNLFCVSVGFLLASLLFVRRLGRRKLWWLRYLVCLIVMFGVSVFLSWLKGNILSALPNNNEDIRFFLLTYAAAVITYCIIFVLGVLSVFAIYKVRISKALFVGSASYALQSMVLSFFSIVMKLIGLDYQFNIQNILFSPFNLIFLLFLFVLIYGLAYVLYVRKYEGENDLSDKVWIFLLVINFINILMSTVNAPSSAEIAADRLYMILLFSKIMLCGGSFVVQFTLSNYYNLQIQQLTLKHMVDQQKIQFEVAKENMDRVNINAHDLRKQLHLILQSVEKGKNDAIELQINDIEKELSIVDSAFHTGNKALDIIFTEKARDCINKEIKLSVMADGCCVAAMDDLDVYMLFGNLLDNAIEAAERVADPENRIISLSLNQNCDCVCMHIENTFEVEAEFIGGVPQTIKKDKRFHGFGVKSIRNIVHKYGGNVAMQISHGMFCVDILMTLENDTRESA